MPFELTSPAFRSGARIPDRHTGEGDDVSPALQWSGAPVGTRSFVLVVEDPDAEPGPFGHWAVFGIPAEWSALPEALAGLQGREVLRFGRNDMGGTGYSGPSPPRGRGPHHYHFRLLAIDTETLRVGAGASVQAIRREAERHRLGEAELVGLYERV